MSKMYCFTIALSFLLAGALHAGPDGFYLIEGDASAHFVDGDGCNVVKVGKHATIGWNRFSVEKGETFRFEQEDSESSVINFVTGESESTLSGNIQSKGKIYLTHPSKIVVTPAAVLNAPQVVLVSEQGNIQVNGTLVASQPSGKGGKIHVLGKEVDIQMTAVIDASGALGEGEVLIGGSFQGKDRSIPHSLQTIVQAGAQISVDSLECGNGGRAIIWSDGTTQYAGHVNARGGPEGGDGGFVEVSGKEQLGFDGTVTTEAPKGKTGELLLDPVGTLFLVDSGGDQCPPNGLVPYSRRNSTVSIPSVFNVLQSNNVTLQAQVQISWSSNSTYSFPAVPGRTLVFEAGSFITMEGNYTINVGSGTFIARVNTTLVSSPIPYCRFNVSPPAKIIVTTGTIIIGSPREQLANPARGSIFDLAECKKVFMGPPTNIGFFYVSAARGGPGGGPGSAVDMPRSPP